jgi:hypothetical protein
MMREEGWREQLYTQKEREREIRESLHFGAYKE